MIKPGAGSTFIKKGRAFYGIGMIAFGILQLIVRDFRPEILPPFPPWAHMYFAFPFVTGIAQLIAGILISGLKTIREETLKEICLYSGFIFFITHFNLSYLL